MKHKLLKILPADRFTTSKVHRLAYSRDMWPKTLLWQRRGYTPYLPDAVVWPQGEDEILRVLNLANQEGIPLVAWGGGSGVCGGTLALCGGIALDFKRLNRILDIDEISNLVWAEAGIMGENLERELNHRGYTLGHFPSSIYCSTLGGWLSTRAAGQLSSKYGKIEDMVASFRVILASGEIIQPCSAPRMATGPDLTQLFLGSEGTLGLIPSAELKIHPLPPHREFLSGCFANLEKGLDGVRALLQSGLKPAALRLYDGIDTLIALHKNPKKDKNHSAFLAYLKKRGLQFLFSHPAFVNRLASFAGKKCLLITTFEGLPRVAQVERQEAEKILAPLGFCEVEGLARHWWNHRYDVSYKQSPIFEQGAFVDTMEVSSSWKNLGQLYYGIKKALEPLAFVMAHFSHGYSTGNSIYFTFGAYHKDPLKLEQLYDQIWDRGLTACLKAGGAISHHHGIGFSKGEYLSRFWGKPLFRLFLSLKKELDPNNILNPGKLGSELD